MKSLSEINPYVREVGLQKMDQWSFKDRRIYDHEFFYCIKGEASVTIEDENFTLTEGSLVLIPPNVPHRLKFKKGIVSEMYYLHFDFFFSDGDDILSELYQDLVNYQLLFLRPLKEELIRERPTFENGYTFPTYLKFSNKDVIESLFRRLYKSYISQDSEMLTKSIFLELLSIIIDFGKEKDYTSQKHRVLAEEMKNFIQNNYYKKILPNEVATRVGLSADYANRIFKKIYGLNLSSYINQFKISMAKKLMLNTDLTLYEISDMVGFKNEYYFSKTFKKLEKHSPGTIRKLLLQEFDDGKV